MSALKLARENFTSGVTSSGRVRANSATSAAFTVSVPRLNSRYSRPALIFFRLLCITSFTVIGSLHFNLTEAE